MLSYTQSFVHGGAMMFTNATSRQTSANPPSDAGGAIPLVIANIGNIRAQDSRGQSEHNCRARFRP